MSKFEKSTILMLGTVIFVFALSIFKDSMVKMDGGLESIGSNIFNGGIGFIFLYCFSLIIALCVVFALKAIYNMICEY